MEIVILSLKTGQSPLIDCDRWNWEGNCVISERSIIDCWCSLSYRCAIRNHCKCTWNAKANFTCILLSALTMHNSALVIAAKITKLPLICITIIPFDLRSGCIFNPRAVLPTLGDKDHPPRFSLFGANQDSSVFMPSGFKRWIKKERTHNLF